MAMSPAGGLQRAVRLLLIVCMLLIVSQTSVGQVQRTSRVRPLHTNRLIHETSPYLLLHAHNPVDWYPWGEEAFQKARRENKLIFLSVGYYTCHWCHVMERESYSKEIPVGYSERLHTFIDQHL